MALAAASTASLPVPEATRQPSMGPPVTGYQVLWALLPVPGASCRFEHHRKVEPRIGGVGLALQVLHHVGQRHRYRGAGVGAGVPGIAGEQRGQVGEVVGEIQLDVPRGTVAGRDAAFPQQETPGASGAVVAVFQVVQAQQGAVGGFSNTKEPSAPVAPVATGSGVPPLPGS